MKPGVYSEVGKLRQVLVCAPGLAHARLTPANCDELLFDDVLWIEKPNKTTWISKTKCVSVALMC